MLGAVLANVTRFVRGCVIVAVNVHVVVGRQQRAAYLEVVAPGSGGQHAATTAALGAVDPDTGRVILLP